MKTAMKRTLAGWMLLLATLFGAGAGHAANTVTYVYTDPQGTPLAEADVNGNMTATFDYAPYGTQALGNAPNGPGYTGHVNDPDTGLVYMQARYYDPATGRFLSVDPVGPSAGNAFNFSRYAYADNNPVTYTDPTGTDCAGGQDGSKQCNSPPPISNPNTPPPPQPKAVTTLGTITVTAPRLPTLEPIAWSELGSGLASLVRGISAPTIIIGGLWPKTMDAPACEMPGGAPCGALSKKVDVPSIGPPGEWVNGKRRSRLYGPDGRPKVDIDNPHQGADYPHVHEWDESGNREHPGREVPDPPSPEPESGS